MMKPRISNSNCIEQPTFWLKKETTASVQDLVSKSIFNSSSRKDKEKFIPGKKLWIDLFEQTLIPLKPFKLFLGKNSI